MTQIEQIKSEIERRMKNNQQDATESGAGAFYEDRQLLSFINTLPSEQPSEEFKEEFKEEFNNFCVHGDIRNPNFEGPFGYDDIRKTAIHFANWQKEQMMKDAVYGLVCGHDDNSPAWIDLNLLNKPDVKVGEEIKLIIIKEK